MATKRPTHVRIAYQILMASQADGSDPMENFPDKFDKFAGQYGISVDDKAQYSFQFEATERILGGMIRSRAKKAQTLKPSRTHSAPTTSAPPLQQPQKVVAPTIKPKRSKHDLTLELF